MINKTFFSPDCVCSMIINMDAFCLLSRASKKQVWPETILKSTTCPGICCLMHSESIQGRDRHSDDRYFSVFVLCWNGLMIAHHSTWVWWINKGAWLALVLSPTPYCGLCRLCICASLPLACLRECRANAFVPTLTCIWNLF